VNTIGIVASVLGRQRRRRAASEITVCGELVGRELRQAIRHRPPSGTHGDVQGPRCSQNVQAMEGGREMLEREDEPLLRKPIIVSS
jgi:hypothetical protein